MVNRLKNGIVIDHVVSGKGIHIITLLAEKTAGHRVILLQHAESRKMGTKDLIKLEDVKLEDTDLQFISLFAPNATVNFIENEEVVRKHSVKAPEMVSGLIRCPNARCITNDPGEAEFLVSRLKRVKTGYICDYCEQVWTTKTYPDGWSANKVGV